MAIRREVELTINFTGGSSVTLTGDAAQNALQDLERLKFNSLKEGWLTYLDPATDKETSVNTACICSYVKGPITPVVEPDEPCENYDCV